MTTIDYSLPFKDKQDFGNNQSASNGQYSNLNLNQNNQNSLNSFSEISKNISTAKPKSWSHACKNEFEAESDSRDTKELYEKGKIEKSASKSVIQPEFPRQQESNDSKIPEVAQYRSSQRLQERTKKMQSQQQAPPTKSQSSRQPHLKIRSKIMQKPAQLSAIKKSKEEVVQATQRSTKKMAPPKLQLSDGEKKAEKTAKECQGSESSEDELDKELKEAERKAKEVDRETKRVEREAKEAELEAKEADLALLLAEKSLELAAWKMKMNYFC
uniref:Uncharacterized protein n=1 Tax=Panagrolaimus davidi TaxID=227884 RepID=A0A914QGJ4_9BILA